MIIKLFLPCIPKAKQSMRLGATYNRSGEPVTYRDRHTGRKRVLLRKFTDKKIEQYEDGLVLSARRQLPTGFVPTDKPIIVKRLVYTFPPLKSMKKAQRTAIEQGNYVMKATKPDLTDNLSKALFDALEGVVYYNDSQICAILKAAKVYGRIPGINLVMEILEDSNLILDGEQTSLCS